jgi:serine/threonine protein kinase, bacterial
VGCGGCRSTKLILTIDDNRLAIVIFINYLPLQQGSKTPNLLLITYYLINMSLSLYPISQQLGAGGFGTTYLATNTLMPSRPYCVVKQLIPTSTDPQLQQLIQDRFKQEAIVLENLGKGSNGMIPMLYHYFVEQGDFYLVQEYIEGQSLSDRIRSYGVFTETQVRQFLNDILPTLTYIHSKGIIHRDIKPDNIMVRQSDNKPVLIDFGAVKEIMTTVMTPSANTARSIVIGTPGFMPMEQVSGRPVFASDLYALSLTAIYLLTGKTPGEIETDPHSGNINWQVYAPNVSQQLAEVLNKSIEYSPRDRYMNAPEMLQSLNNLSTQNQVEKTTIAPIPNIPERTVYIPTTPVSNDPSPEKSQLNPILMALIGVVIGGTLIAGGLVLGKISTSDDSKQARSENADIVNAPPSISSSSAIGNDSKQAASEKADSVNAPPSTSSPSTIPSPIPNTANSPRITSTDIVKDYYSKINTRDFQGAWNKLPSSLQNDRSIHPNGYNSFLDWWSNKVGSIQLQGTNLVSETDREAIVDADVQYFMRSGQGRSTPQAMRYFFIKDPNNNTWVIDKIRLR